MMNYLKDKCNFIIEIFVRFFKKRSIDSARDLIYKKIYIGNCCYFISDICQEEFEITIKLKNYEEYKKKNTYIKFEDFELKK